MRGFSRRWVGWRLSKNALIAIFGAGLFFILYIWRLGTLTSGVSAHERAAISASSTIDKIIDNPINAPHKILQFIFQYFGHNGAFWMRSISVLFAFLFLVSVYFAIKNWFGKFTAIIGTIFCAATPLAILVGRSASTEIMFFSPILIISAYVLLSRTKKHLNLIWFLFIFSLVICIYSPGVIWFIVVALIIGHKQITKSILSVNGLAIIPGFTFLILLVAPLVYAFYQTPSLYKELFLIPDNLPPLIELAKTFVWSLSSLLFKLPAHIDYAIGRLPIFDIAQCALAALGVYVMSKKAKKELVLVTSLITVAVLFATLSGNMLVLCMSIPAIAILAAAGIRYLYVKWFTVFPLNPLARAFALSLILLVLATHVVYGARYALIAWPHNVETRKTYVIH